MPLLALPLPALPLHALPLLALPLAMAACEADPVGGTGVRAETHDIGSSSPDSFLPVPPATAPPASVPSTTPASDAQGPASPPANTATQRDGAVPDAAEPVADAVAMDEQGRAPIPICDPAEDDAGVDPAAGCAVVGDLVVQYRVGDTDPLDNQVRAQFKLLNNGSTAIPLTEVTLRYWYTKETTAPAQEFHCDYAQMGAERVRGSFAASTLPGADQYMEVSFTAGELPAGGDTGEIQTRFNTEGWANYDESDDYSYDGTVTEYEDWERVTLYLNGALIWGAEPRT